VLTSLYHELAVLSAVAFLVLISWGEPNQIGTWTFVVLWLMRWSAKLNLFLGVPNLNDWLPDHLAYLKTYMPKRSMNLLFPISVTLPTVIVTLLVVQALGTDASSFAVVGLILVATLLALGILEHWFLVLPLPDEALWAWALPPRDDAGDVADAASADAPVQRRIAVPHPAIPRMALKPAQARNGLGR
jgi:putative photosynthetic complex assembly protein 2